MGSDMVNGPRHYGGASALYETIKVLEAWLTPDQLIGFCRGNAIKYQSRADRKANPSEDLAKSAFYANYEIDFRARLAAGDIGEVRGVRMAGGIVNSILDDHLRQAVAALGLPAETLDHRGQALAVILDAIKALRSSAGAAA